jgi:glycosyltransferase involved in cell wall biosynthesis
MDSASVPRIIGFLQVRNEIASGHLERFIKQNLPLLDCLVVYDDASDDGTAETIEPFCDVLIRGTMPLFGDELRSRQQLLDASAHLASEQDFYLWLDADEVLYASKDELLGICQKLHSENYDGARLPHVNLWRSNFFYRTDDYYDDLYPVRLWRAGANLSFPLKSGLHNEMHPLGINSIARLTKPSVVHYGFASDQLLEDKFALYQSYGQRGRNLYRLVSEEGRTLEPLNNRADFLGARFDTTFGKNATEPEVRNQISWLLGAAKSSERRQRKAKPLVTLISLIYCSVEWLEFEYAELLKVARYFAEGSIEILFVANNPTPDVLSFLQENLIPHVVADTQRSSDEWFINYVYRGYNEGVKAARGDYVFLTNSDMAYAPGCLQSLLREAAPNRLLTSRLVELGRLQTGKYGIEKDFGAVPARFRRRQFESYAAEIREPQQAEGGLFMPLLVSKETFLELGGYPEGNLSMSSLSSYLETGVVTTYALPGEECVPGDTAFFQRAKLSGVEHHTLFDSLSYHFQAGERTSESKKGQICPSGVAIVNDRIDGVNNELVLWRQLANRLSALGVRTQTIGAPTTEVRFAFWNHAMRKLRHMETPPRIVFTNASFTYPFLGPWRRVLMRQDAPEGTRLPDKWLQYWQRMNTRTSHHLISNDPSFAAGFKMGIAEWLSVPLSPLWEEEPPHVPRDVSQPVGLFVGAFAPVKGWAEIKEFIIQNPEIHWHLVSKYASDEHGLPESTNKNWSLHRNLDQIEIRRLMRESTFLVVNSPYETQCLVALEAASQNLPILTTPTGMLGSLEDDIARNFGEVGPHPLTKLPELIERIRVDPALNPRDALLDLGVLGEKAWASWDKMFEEQLRLSFRDTTDPGFILSFVDRLRGALTLKSRQIYREKLVPPLLRILKPLRRS